MNFGQSFLSLCTRKNTANMNAIKRIILAISIATISINLSAGTPLDTLKARYDQNGNPERKYLFPKTEGTNLRILDANIWEWNGTKDQLPKAWIEAGEDCTNENRAMGYAGMVDAYLPEIISLQEYAMAMDKHLRPMLKKSGYEMTFVPDSLNFTPIYYKKNKVKLLETAYYSHELPFNNHSTKSFTTAVFRLKSNGKKFIVINTHLWWKSEKAMPGSDNARTEQLKRIMNIASELMEKHNCPVFLMGDMNCNLRSEAMSNVLAEGYRPAWEIATEFGDLRCGHHQCSKDGFSRKQNKTDDGFGCIDHFLIYDTAESVEVKVFMRDYAWYTVKLTDHYPNYADIVLK